MALTLFSLLFFSVLLGAIISVMIWLENLGNKDRKNENFYR